MTGLPPAEEAIHYPLLNGRRPRASSTSSGCGTSGRFGDVALCARIPRSGSFEAPSSPSGCFKRTLWGTLWGRSVMRPTAGRLAPHPRSVRARRAGRRTSPPSETRTDKATSPKRPTGPRSGASSPKCKKGRRPGMRATAWGREGGGPGGGRRSKGRGPPRAPLPRRGRDSDGKGSRSPRSGRGRAPRPAGG